MIFHKPTLVEGCVPPLECLYMCGKERARNKESEIRGEDDWFYGIGETAGIRRQGGRRRK